MTLSPRVHKHLAITAKLCGVVIAKGDEDLMAQVFESDLGCYSEEQIVTALARCRKELTIKNPNLLACIVERIEQASPSGWPAPNEAWAAVGTVDEARTVVCVDEAYEALRDVRALLDDDEIGARMAFLEAYKRKVVLAKAEGRKPHWRVSLGHDAAGRRAVLTAAVESGRLPAAQVAGLLSEPVGMLRLHGRAVGQLSAPAPVDNARQAGQLLVMLADPAFTQTALNERRRESQKVYRVVAGEVQPVPGIEVPLREPLRQRADFVLPNREQVAELRAANGQEQEAMLAELFRRQQLREQGGAT